MAWRLRNGCFSVRGLWNKSKLLTEPWSDLPDVDGGVWAFYFHPEELTEDGIRHFADNLARLREIPGVEFVTASAFVASMG
jgi:hypothetical protein